MVLTTALVDRPGLFDRAWAPESLCPSGIPVAVSGATFVDDPLADPNGWCRHQRMVCAPTSFAHFLGGAQTRLRQTRQGSEPVGILAQMDAPGPRYRDREESRFYQAGGLSPEHTWQALGDELTRVLGDAQRAFWRAPLQMDPERVRWWHGAIFARRFPHDGGRFRRDRAFFGVVIPNGGMRQLEGRGTRCDPS